MHTSLVAAIESACVCFQVKLLIGYLKIDIDGTDGTDAVVQCAESRDTLKKPICFYPGT